MTVRSDSVFFVFQLVTIMSQSTDASDLIDDSKWIVTISLIQGTATVESSDRTRLKLVNVVATNESHEMT
jgi:hypothetical protein